MMKITCPLVAQLVKNPPAMRDTWVRSLGWEDPLEKGKATHSSLPSDALSQHLPSYLGFSYLGHGVSLHGCSRKHSSCCLPWKKCISSRLPLLTLKVE